jgi:hypothetical protein
VQRLGLGLCVPGCLRMEAAGLSVVGRVCMVTSGLSCCVCCVVSFLLFLFFSLSMQLYFLFLFMKLF